MAKLHDKERILKGKEKGIRFICKKHWYMSMISPCSKCVEEIGEKMPKPLPRKDTKEYMKDILSIFDGKVGD